MEYIKEEIMTYTFPYREAKGDIDPDAFKSIPFFITKGNPTCYANVILPDGTLVQIPYQC